jgi:hypothetical protein
MTAAYFEDHPTDPDKVILRKPRHEDDDDIQEYKRSWVGLEKTDMPDGEDPMYDHPFFIAGMVWAANKLKEKNT